MPAPGRSPSERSWSSAASAFDPRLIWEPVNEDRSRSIQIVWIIPIVAALIGGWLAVMAILERGPTMRIIFNTAEVLEAGKTTIKYKNVNIGTVMNIEFSEDRSQVIAMAQLTPQAEGFLVEDTRFWVVRIAGSQISGLGTLVSGFYIGVDIGKSTKRKRKFTGLETPPIVTADLLGREFVLSGPRLARHRLAGLFPQHPGRAGRGQESSRVAKGV
ncbi:MAG: MlaD family protein [Gammaproteobacteria bacterium]